MLKRDVLILGVVGTQFAFLAGVLALRKASGAAPAPRPVPYSAADVIGNKPGLAGKNTAPFTLVEWGDYQCPPCAATAPQVEQLLAAHPDALRLQFRHLPLSIHPLAQQAAVIAEAQRPQGSFWKMHHLLYAKHSLLSEAELQDRERTLTKQERQNALRTVALDAGAAGRCGVRATPTFFLCKPDGSVLHLGSLEQAEPLLKP